MKFTKKLGWPAILLAAILAGCGTNETGSEAEEAAAPTAEEVLASSTEAAEELSSYDMDMTMDISMGFPGESGNFTMTTNADGSFTTDPLAFQMTMDVMGESMDMYMVDNYMYLLEPTSQQWIKTDIAAAGDLGLDSGQTASIDEQINQLNELSDNIELTEEENEYVLTVQPSPEELEALINESMGLTGQSMTELEGVSFDNVHYTFSLNKENYYPTAVVLDMDMTVEEQGEEYTANYVMDAAYSNYNGVDTIELPADAASAVDYGEAASYTY